MKFYIAGKISGDAGYREKFERAAADIGAAEGDIVINPAVLPKGLSAGETMKICFAMIDVADVVYFLEDYQDSRGAMLEWQYCQYVSKQTMYQSPMVSLSKMRGL